MMRVDGLLESKGGSTPRYFSKAAALAVLAAVLQACADPVSPPARQSIIIDIEPQKWACYDPTDPHCINDPPPDPDPSAPGIYLGPDFTWAACTTGSTDLDLDGLGDFCEYQLAVSFRPLLSTHPNDYALSREPYWAVTRHAQNFVRIAYMFAYHLDPGNTHFWGCHSSPFAYHCKSHLGDSEFVIADVRYNGFTTHWELEWLNMSQHGNVISAPASWVEYPATDLWYPRVYVARDKHANYHTRSHCNDGGFLGSDSCDGNVDDARFDVDPIRNVGSTQVKWINSTTSSHNPLLYPGTEYFWTPFAFCGWFASRDNCADTPYGSVLANHGF